MLVRGPTVLGASAGYAIQVKDIKKLTFEKKVTQIVFEGERFDVMSIRRWRERLLGQPLQSPTT